MTTKGKMFKGARATLLLDGKPVGGTWECQERKEALAEIEELVVKGLPPVDFEQAMTVVFQPPKEHPELVDLYFRVEEIDGVRQYTRITEEGEPYVK